jgi:hypothetical protein
MNNYKTYIPLFTFMKYLLSYWLLALAFCATSYAQVQSHCGTELPETARQQLRYARQQYALQPKGQEPTRYIPIKLHIVGTDTGAGYFDAIEAYRLICELNEDYIPVGFHFYLAGDLHYIDNSSYYIHDFGIGEEMMVENNVDGVINVYIVQDPAGTCGYFTWGGDAVAINKSCAGEGSTTLAHELGHYFFLPHTFSGWEGAFEGATLVDEPPANEQERVNGSNCANTADEFCDTPADYLSYRWDCPYNGNLSDPTGAAIDPDETLYMSYSADECQGRFSNEQIDAMHATLNEFRDYLIQPQPNTEQPYNTYLYYPPNGTLVIDPDHVLFSWRPVVNADRYLLLVTPNGTGERVEIYTTDTFYVANLSANTNYTMKLLPLSSGNTCTAPRKIIFKTATANMLYVADLDVQMPICNEENNGAITLGAGGGTAPYTYLWTGGTTGDTKSGLGSSIYYVTITDATGSTAKVRFTLPQPDAIEASAEVTGNTVAVTIAGGLPPYTFNWVTGTNQESIQNSIPAGTYSMLITDAAGCTMTLDYVVTSILSVANPNQALDISVYPTILYGNADLNIQLKRPTDKVQLSLISLSGQIVSRQTATDATSTLHIPTDGLPAGMYWLNIQTSQGSNTQKIAIVR